MSWRGTITTLFILAGVGAVLLLNREPGEPAKPNPSETTKAQNTEAKQLAVASSGTVAPDRSKEHPIGDEVIKNHIQVAAVWLASVGMDGRPISEGQKLIHLEADIRATAQNPNGFAKNEFVPYLKVRYKILNSVGKLIQSGEMLPMVAFDGLHYGANIEQPTPGTYQLQYEIDPPSAGGLGRHSDPVTGVAPWWQPFATQYEWIIDPTK